MAVLSSIHRKISKVSPLTRLANKVSPGAKDLMSITDKEKVAPRINEPVTVAGKARARSAASYLGATGNILQR